MQNKAQMVLRVGLGITFVWVSILVWMDPLAWGNMLQPWAQDLLIFPLKTMMITTAIFDMIVGLLLIFGRFTFIASSLAFLHMLVVLIFAGVTIVTVRDIGLLAAALSVSLSNWPANWPSNWAPKA